LRLRIDILSMVAANEDDALLMMSSRSTPAADQRPSREVYSFRFRRVGCALLPSGTARIGDPCPDGEDIERRPPARASEKRRSRRRLRDVQPPPWPPPAGFPRAGWRATRGHTYCALAPLSLTTMLQPVFLTGQPGGWASLCFDTCLLDAEGAIPARNCCLAPVKTLRLLSSATSSPPESMRNGPVSVQEGRLHGKPACGRWSDIGGFRGFTFRI